MTNLTHPPPQPLPQILFCLPLWASPRMSVQLTGCYLAESVFSTAIFFLLSPQCQESAVGMDAPPSLSPTRCSRQSETGSQAWWPWETMMITMCGPGRGRRGGWGWHLWQPLSGADPHNSAERYGGPLAAVAGSRTPRGKTHWGRKSILIKPVAEATCGVDINLWHRFCSISKANNNSCCTKKLFTLIYIWDTTTSDKTILLTKEL